MNWWHDLMSGGIKNAAIFTGIGFFLAILHYVFAKFLRTFFARKAAVPHQAFSLKLGDSTSVVYVGRSTSKNLGLGTNRGTRIVITSIDTTGRKPRRLKQQVEDLGYRDDKFLPANTIEISERSLTALFGGNEWNDGDTIHLKLEKYRLTGLEEFWRDPDDRTRFANKFAVYLALGILSIEIAINILPMIFD